MSRYNIDPNIIESGDLLVPNSVTVYYKEFIDFNDDWYEGILDGDSHTDTFIAYGMLKNADGELVPVLYDTDMADEENPEYATMPDYEAPFFYTGTAIIDGITYDKWRKIEGGDSEFTWDTDAQQYIYTNIITVPDEKYLIYKSTLTSIANTIRGLVKTTNDSVVEGCSYTIDSSVIESDGILISDSVEVYFREFIDFNGDLYQGIFDGNHVNDNFVAYDYLENNEGIVVPVLYKTATDYADEGPDYADACFYVGTSTIDEITYDKWRKIEDDNTGYYTWDSDEQQYLYTNIIVQAVDSEDDSSQAEGMTPAQMPDKITEVYDKGYSIGYKIGVKTGYNEGYDKGIIDGNISVKIENISKNGVYDVSEWREANVTVPSVSTVQTPEDLPATEPNESIAMVLNAGEVTNSHITNSLNHTSRAYWAGMSTLTGTSIWKDNDNNIYYSSFDKHYVLNGNTWEPKAWYGLTNFTSGDHIWTDNNGNIYYSYSFFQYILSGNTWKKKTWKGLTSFYGNAVWKDNNGNVYYSHDTKQYVLNGDTWEPKSWNGLTDFSGENVWKDNDGNIYYSYNSNYYMLNGDTWEVKTWEGIPYFYGDAVWSDGSNIYYSSGSNQYVLNGDKWEEKTWEGISYFYGSQIWKDNQGNIYHSNGRDSQHVLNGGLWESKTWIGLANFNGDDIWSDGNNAVYHSDGSAQYVLNGNVWEVKTWNGLTNFYGSRIWSDGQSLYYSNGPDQYVLNGDKWEVKTWNGLTNFYGDQIWKDNSNNIYYSKDSKQYTLNGDTWEIKIWNGLIDFTAEYIWSDNNGNIYYSNYNQYILNGNVWEEKTWNGLSHFYGNYIWKDNNGNIYYSYDTEQYILIGNTWKKKKWSGLTSFYGNYIWKDNDGNIYFSRDAKQYEFSQLNTKIYTRLDDEWVPICGINDYEEGKKAEYDKFWDIHQNYGNRSAYNYAFSYGWTNENFKPKYDIRPTGDYGASQMFTFNEYNLDLAAGLAHNGVSLDLSQATRWNSIFDRSNVINIPPLDAKSCTVMTMSFYNNSKITSLTVNNIREDCTFDRTFNYMYSLVDLNLTGIIGNTLSLVDVKELANFNMDGLIAANINFAGSPKLTTASVQSIIDALKDLTGQTAQTLTFHADVGAKLTEEQKATITAKNWQLVY